MEDFELLEATIALWKSRIVASPKEEPANGEHSNTPTKTA